MLIHFFQKLRGDEQGSPGVCVLHRWHLLRFIAQQKLPFQPAAAVPALGSGGDGVVPQPALPFRENGPQQVGRRLAPPGEHVPAVGAVNQIGQRKTIFSTTDSSSKILTVCLTLKIPSCGAPSQDTELK